MKTLPCTFQVTKVHRLVPPEIISFNAFRAVKKHYPPPPIWHDYKHKQRKDLFKMGAPALYQPYRFDFIVAGKCLIAYQLRKQGWGLKAIAAHLGLKDHSSAIHLLTKVKDRKFDIKLNDAFETFIKIVGV